MCRWRWPRQAIDRAAAIAAEMDYVGVLCVEFFVVDDGHGAAMHWWPTRWRRDRTIPGHYTLDACDLSQFDLQVRTLAGMPLVAPRLHSPCVMLKPAGRPVVA